MAEIALTAQRILVSDLTLTSHIGVTASERSRPQRIRINLEVEIDPKRPDLDKVAEVVDYSRLLARVRETCAETDTQLLETLGGKIAEACFGDRRVQRARVRIEKLDRYSDVAGVGVEVVYHRSAP